MVNGELIHYVHQPSFTIHHCPFTMILFPNCKINLGLNIIRKREDGYHDLETIFYPVELKDALEGISLGESNPEAGVLFSSTGLEFQGDAADNLSVKAWHLLKKDFPAVQPVQMHLHKVIPMGAGLGGGSADGAFSLRLIDQLFRLHLSHEQLVNYALQLGSDCPFFILNKPCYATGRGEQLQEITLDLSGYQFVIVYPGIHVSTAEAFSTILPAKPLRSVSSIIQLPVQQWKELLVNDFERPVCSIYPEIAFIKNELYHKGAVYASMTGSGSSVYGIFEKGVLPGFSFDASYKVFSC